MPVEATDVDTPFEPETADADQQDAQSPVETPVESPQSPKKSKAGPRAARTKPPEDAPFAPNPGP